jgi:hypothetical protein
MAKRSVVVLPPLIGGQAESWAALGELAPAFGENWLLVGGQMVFLHEVERGAADTRPTDDVDVVVDLRAEPKVLSRIHSALSSAGFVQDSPGPEGVAHRYRRGGAAIDILAPDNVGPRAQLHLGAGRTIEAPGTSQALRRSGVVTVQVAGVEVEIRRPDVVGALLGKASAVVMITSQSPASRAKHLRDFDSLARLLGVSDRQAAQLTKSERRMLLSLATDPELSQLAAASVRLIVDGTAL